MNEHEVIVIGAGIIGLTTAVALQQAGYAVRIVTAAAPENTTSSVAAAVWYPYRAYPKERVLGWSKTTRERLEELATHPKSGVSLIRMIELNDEPVDEPWWASAAPPFRHPRKSELRPDYVDGYVMDIPLIEAPIHLKYLKSHFSEQGGQVDVLSNPLASLEQLASAGRPVVNCSGLGARTLADDKKMYPIRGQVVRVSNPGVEQCVVDDHGPRAVSYVIPRSEDCILGGTAERGDWELSPRTETTEQILRHARHLVPALADAEVLEVKVGLRPGRPAVRLEAESVGDALVIHNYGHGGAGYTLAWGCAREVVELLNGHFG